MQSTSNNITICLTKFEYINWLSTKKERKGEGKKDGDLNFIRPKIVRSASCHSRRPSSSSSSSSSSNNFKRRAYCSSRFFFCHILKRENDNSPTITSNINMIKTVEPVLFLELEWASAFLSFLESSEMPEMKRTMEEINFKLNWSIVSHNLILLWT